MMSFTHIASQPFFVYNLSIIQKMTTVKKKATVLFLPKFLYFSVSSFHGKDNAGETP